MQNYKRQKEVLKGIYMNLYNRMFTCFQRCDLLKELHKIKFHAVATLIYISVLVISCTDYKNQFIVKKQADLQEYYQIIFHYSLVELNDMLSELSFNANKKNILIEIKKSDIIACSDKRKCIKKNLLKFSSTLEKYLPDYAYYEVHINEEILTKNAALDNYQLKKYYALNDKTQLSIYVSLKEAYLDKLNAQTYGPFRLIIISSTLFFILFIVSNRFLIKHSNNFHLSYFGNLFDNKLQIIKKEYDQKISEKENSLMQKIWNVEYKTEKDKEINLMFSQKANQMAFFIPREEGLSLEQYTRIEQQPCSIILYQTNAEKEKISIQKIIKKFSGRFTDLEEGISIIITGSDEYIYFSSKEFLYQIIYSIINCIMFILKEQNSIKNNEIRFDITTYKGKQRLFWSYSGLPIKNKKDLIKLSDKFLNNTANPFCLSMNHIFTILKNDNFDCIVGCDDLNYITITEKIELTDINNIIAFNK